MKTLTKVLIGGAVIFEILLGSHIVGELGRKNIEKSKKTFTQLQYPKPKENQKIIEHLDGYTLLTDLDSDKKWDVVEIKYVGGTPGNYSHKFYFKKGFNPGQSLEGSEFVGEEFFNKYNCLVK